MDFYDLNISLESTDDFDDVVSTAKRIGYSGICLIEKYASLDKFNKIKKMANNVDYLKIITGIEIDADGVKEMKRMVSKASKLTNFIVVSGGKYKINRAATEDNRVSLLSHPEYKRSDSGVDHIMAKFATRNNVAIEINFHEILETFRKVRSFVFSHMKENIELAQKFNTPVVITSGARSKWDMRDPRELSSIGQILGLSLEDSMKAVSQTSSIVGGFNG